jgi:hypothetical protein
VVAEVAREIDDPHMRVACVQIERDAQRVVGRTVVDQHDFVGLGQRPGCGGASRVEIRQEARRGVHRRDDRQRQRLVHAKVRFGQTSFM